MNTNHEHAFTLVELAIILVILGLLVGGVLVGSTLIRGGELRAVTSEYQRYTTAMTGFKDKYFALPGDMTNATSVWGTDADGCPGTNAAITYSAATCNGDGDGTFDVNASTSNEDFRAWQQLANAGFIEGSYSGVANSVTATHAYAKIGTNVPRSKLSAAGWSIYNLSIIDVTSVIYFESTYNNVFLFGGEVATNMTINPIIKAEDAYNIDTKLDDAKPGSGNVLVLESQSDCHDAGTSNIAELAGTAAYDLDNTNIGCALVFKTNTY